ncbi:1,4-dihydroxy-2-naphthoate prenyltransferase [Flagellimonas taeanensis]|uniref:1,4-dihydroxy-2-naphthoate octaprenyltransferase n=1 Tax=Flagellimonas taeanensis TaxID=1005926 RepID=A0A1M6VAF4_9FLAO|nr:1,4-dihydroxy-2-naphthoate octaprenyltransferase [Allomuricauda taeanensis]SFC19232.1 1,4-dihydroxy-2-naphthoate prenyltransferase [Allomuricauda taeanensis]SHK78460.1 1,4-dihydroxy-2-naphthoate prenyltransferase [Allomuricauda taeanensis]
MGKAKTWVRAARLRTLPLSLSGIIVGTAMAAKQGFFQFDIFVLALLTTVGFQITSNFANDYGDGVKGTDNEDRIGPQRVLQSGLLSRKALKKGIIVSIAISMLLAIILIYKAFGLENLVYIFIFFILGAMSIWAAIRYTMGSNPYGYKGLGDLYVFLFFGLLGVLGSMFLYTKALDWHSVLPATGLGLLCVGVLNLNNLRDIVSDKKHGKITLVVKMGFNNGKRYHFLLMSISFVCFLLYVLVEELSWKQGYFMLAFVPILIHIVKVLKTHDPGQLDGELKKLALSSFLLAILFFSAINIFL